MGWYPEAAKNMLRATGKSSLKIVSGENGKGYQKPSCKAKDRDPGHGTSDYATALKEGGTLAYRFPLNPSFNDVQRGSEVRPLLPRLTPTYCEIRSE